MAAGAGAAYGAAMPAPGSWLQPHPEGIYVAPGDFWIDPSTPKPAALITHGHADHARSGHGKVLATRETLAIMDVRYGEQAGQGVAYGETVRIGDVSARFVPAGHVLGSAQIVLDHGGERIVVSGDYKRRPDPTCAPFEPVPCDIFVTEATFGLPVFHHPDTAVEVGKALDALRANPERCVLIGAYALGKAQRVIAELRALGHDAPIFIHGAVQRLCDLYVALGVDLGELRPATGLKPAELKGSIVIAPPSALNDRWSRRLPDPITAMASGWMRVRQRAVQRQVELPLIISDHADWAELTDTCTELAPNEVWVTHGREEALVHWCMTRQIRARALDLVGREDEDD
ncbi:MAG: ligase-associated DNA damage response exonuclease [Janthinobacterium lividum]